MSSIARLSSFLLYQFLGLGIGCLLLCSLRISGDLQAAVAEPSVTTLFLDRTEHAVPQSGAVVVSHGVRDIQVRFKSSSETARSARLRYKLVGFDNDWRELPGHMRVTLTFYDKQGAVIAAASEQMSGMSPGWSSMLADSEFSDRALEALSPIRAHAAQVEFVSGGAESTLGIYAFRHLCAEVTAEDGSVRRLSFPVDASANEADASTAPPLWRRSGTEPQMAATMRAFGRAGSEVMLLEDNSVQTYASWRLGAESRIRVSPNEKVRLTWKEAYSIGAGGAGVADYRFLRPGEYDFQIQATTLSGEPLGMPSHLPLFVRPPLWQEPWLWIGSAAFAGASIFVISKHLTKRRMQRKMAELERLRSLESERTRIAQDIHDDLGAGLAQIALLSELIQADAPGSEEARTHLDEIFRRAHESGRKLDEIVWAINPVYDSIEELVGYLARFGQEYLCLARVRFRLDVPAILDEVPLNAVHRHHLFLAVKEAIHNAVKYAAPREIVLRVRVDAAFLIITVKDDGGGFVDTTPSSFTRGSASMLNRMEKLHGTFKRTSELGVGTSVVFTLPLSSFQ